ncbi:MAG: FAD-binding protein [Spirochaetales bacterium]|jgi:succinate dehydrogenase/fumarate reductase flavoprotein subunit|nr:FAD-binding protein [Spirochaetales bacterium]
MSGLSLDIRGRSLPVRRVHTLVVGSGAASLAAADRLHEAGVTDIAIVTEDLAGGTSLNTGSDKQTYYKLAAASKVPDSPYEMAKALYSGGSMHGDIALVEAVCSLEAFYHLVSIGVPFPVNRYGGVVGYKTDHDPKDRGTSIGPYTSKAMVEQLLREVRRRGIPIYDKHDAVSLLVQDGRAVGALCMDKNRLDDGRFGLRLFMADVTVFGVGGPGGIYEASVYPPVQSGAIGLALEAGAEAVNLTESQYGLASVKFRWNVSGTYQQVIPRYISTDPDGGDEREFLPPFFADAGKMNSAVFLKGYQWPFDPRKIEDGGSSLIDILVYRERVLLGRRVFLDYRENPGGKDFCFDKLCAEAYSYLENSGALFGLPIQRLEKMNPLAIELYKTHGIDLYREPLEIAVSAQHNNGGLAADIWWESTNIGRLFPVGEVNGSHGVYRPGGSALNSGQVGALRAARKIAGAYRENDMPSGAFEAAARRETEKIIGIIESILDENGGSDTAADSYRKEFQRRMSAAGAHIRGRAEASKALAEALDQAAAFTQTKIRGLKQLPSALRNRRLVLAHTAYLSALSAYLEAGGGSRGSYLVMDPEGREVHPKLETRWRCKPEAEEFRDKLLVTRLDESGYSNRFIPRRPIPDEDFWFEKVWRENRENAYF